MKVAKRKKLYISKLSNSLLTLGLLATLSPANVSLASYVSREIPYQTYLDFGSSKGIFKPGEVNIPIQNVDGTVVGNLELPMIDFAPVGAITGGFTTLIGVNNLASVKHNGGYKSTIMGNYDGYYHIVDRNNFLYHKIDTGVETRVSEGFADFHNPRLDHLVLETAPAPYLEGNRTALYNLHKSSDRFADYYYRTGSGTMFIGDIDRKRDPEVVPDGIKVTGAYGYNLGGIFYKRQGGNYVGPWPKTWTHFMNLPVHLDVWLNPGKGTNSLLPNRTFRGDSGSPIFAYDKIEKKWVMFGVLRADDNFNPRNRNDLDYTGVSTYVDIPEHFVDSAQNRYKRKLYLEGANFLYQLSNDKENHDKYGSYLVSTKSLNEEEANSFRTSVGAVERNTTLLETKGEKSWKYLDSEAVKTIKDATVVDNWGQMFLGKTSGRFNESSNVADDGKGYIQDDFDANSANDLIIISKNPSEESTWSFVDSLDSGAGYLHFTQGKYNLTAANPSSGASYNGSGILIDQGAEVRWSLDTLADDPLYRIGAGKLTIEGSRAGTGELRVGDGLTLINRPDVNQAFSKLYLASGRPTVKLISANVVPLDGVGFGFRGGILDVNGHSQILKNTDFSVKRLFNDFGGVLTNSNTTQRSTLTLNPGLYFQDVTNEDVTKTNSAIGFRKVKNGEIEVSNRDYFGKLNSDDIRTKAPGYYLPFEKTNIVRDKWTRKVIFEETLHLSSNFDEAKKEAHAIYQKTNHQIYHGQITGNFDVDVDGSVYNSLSAESKARVDAAVAQKNLAEGKENVNTRFFFDGEINTTGALVVKGANITFQGHPLAHATSGTQDMVNTIQSVYGKKVNGIEQGRTQPTFLDQPDWETRNSVVDSLTLTNSNLEIARNARLEVKNLSTLTDSTIIIGSSKAAIDTKDSLTLYGGEIIYGETAEATLDADKAVFKTGKLHLKGNSSLTVTNGFFEGSIINESNVPVELNKNSLLNLDQDSFLDKVNADSVTFNFNERNLKLAKSNDIFYRETTSATLKADFDRQNRQFNYLTLVNPKVSNSVFNLKVDDKTEDSSILFLDGDVQGSGNTLNIHFKLQDEENAQQNNYANSKEESPSTSTAADAGSSDPATSTTNSDSAASTEGREASDSTLGTEPSSAGKTLTFQGHTNKESYEIPLVVATRGTSHNFFTLPSIQRGFTTYAPNIVVEEQEFHRGKINNGEAVELDSDLANKDEVKAYNDAQAAKAAEEARKAEEAKQAETAKQTEDANNSTANSSNGEESASAANLASSDDQSPVVANSLNLSASDRAGDSETVNRESDSIYTVWKLKRVYHPLKVNETLPEPEPTPEPTPEPEQPNPVQPEPQPEPVQPETQPSTKPETQPGIIPDSKPVTKPEIKPEIPKDKETVVEEEKEKEKEILKDFFLAQDNKFLIKQALSFATLPALQAWNLFNALDADFVSNPRAYYQEKISHDTAYKYLLENKGVFSLTASPAVGTSIFKDFDNSYTQGGLNFGGEYSNKYGIGRVTFTYGKGLATHSGLESSSKVFGGKVSYFGQFAGFTYSLSGGYYHHKDKLDLSWFGLEKNVDFANNVLVASASLGYNYEFNDNLNLAFQQKLGYFSTQGYNFANSEAAIATGKLSSLISTSTIGFNAHTSDGSAYIGASLGLEVASAPGKVDLIDEHKVRTYQVPQHLGLAINLAAGYQLTPNLQGQVKAKVSTGTKVSTSGFGLQLNYNF